MGLKDLVDKRKDILFAEIGALVHDLGKLSEEFVEQTTTGNIFDHSLIMGRDYRYNVLNNYSKTPQELDKIIKNINSLGVNLTSKNINKILAKEINSVLPPNLSNKEKKKKYSDFLILLKSKYSNKNYSDKLDFLENYQMLSGITLADLLSKHHNKKHHNKEKYLPNGWNNNCDILLSLLQKGADGIDSAIDKMVPENVSDLRQSENNTYISTAFGYEKQKIDLVLPDTDEKPLTKIRNDYTNNLAMILKDLKNNPVDIQNWIEKRNKLLKETKKAFLNALGETRRPANDVTLWDHSFSVASLYKAALAEVLVNRWKDPEDIKWKLLSIRFDGNAFYNSVPKIADVLGRKALIERMLDTIKDFLEVITPIGNEIYRDENGSIFLMPESASSNKIFEITEELWHAIKDIKIKAKLDYKGDWEEIELGNIVNKHDNIGEIINEIFSYMSGGILVPFIQLSEASRGALNLGGALGESLEYKFDIERLKGNWKGKEEDHEKCSVCGLRPVPLSKEEYDKLEKKIKDSDWGSLEEDEKNHYKAYERKVCEFCLKVSEDRVNKWYNNKKWNIENPEDASFDTSIWLDEIADENNRIGLVYISFDLEKWLNGEMLNTFFANPLLIEDFKQQFEELVNVKNYKHLLELLKEGFDKNDISQLLSVKKWDGTDLSIKDFLKNFVHIERQTLEDVFKSIVENREPDWKEEDYPVPEGAQKGDNLHKAAVFLLHQTRKHPSFARLRRIWETTRNFGIEIFERTKGKAKEKQRLVFEFSNLDALRLTHTYYLKDKNENKFEIVVLKNGKACVISSKNDFTLNENNSVEVYSDENLKNYIGNLTITKKTLQSYKPIIPYQFQPQNTMFFVPLKNVWEIIKLIKQEYEIQFNKVQNRLPIKVGFVAFHKRTPMYAVLDAAKRLSSQKIELKTLEISEITEMNLEEKSDSFGNKLGKKTKKITFKNGETYYVSYSTGDINKEDLFHPYFIVENNNGWKVPINREWKAIKHVKDLKAGDKVEFYPSYFDFLYLDTNTRRLDVGKDRKHWIFREKSPKPYRLKKIEEFRRLKDLLIKKLKLTSSQLLNAYGMLIDKFQMWELDKTNSLPIKDDTIDDFVENVILSNPFRLKIKDETKKGQITKEDLDFLKNTMLNGVFFDFIDMWHTVLKRKFKEEQNAQ